MVLVTGMLPVYSIFKEYSPVLCHISSSVLSFFLQHERKASIGVVVPASSCGLLWALGQTKLRAQPAVPKGTEKVCAGPSRE